jgi:serine/threonine-protein kinase
MSDLYIAEDTTLPRQVVLKFLSERLMDDKRNVERFLREAQAASALDHPNICTIYEVGATPDGRSFIAMPFYEGRTVRDILVEGPLPILDALTFGVGIADGLAKAHFKGILHRDIKPANLLVTPDRVIKVLDFGLAKLTLQPHTTSGAIMGTVPYMSPEQATGKAVDERSDIFSLGTTLYEMVTGCNPFLAENPAAVIHKITTLDPGPLSSIRADIPSSLECIILKALKKDPAERYQKMRVLRDDLGDVLHGMSADTVPRLAMAPHQRARRALVVAAGMLLVVATVAGVLNRQRIADRFGWGGVGEKKGVVILTLDGDDADRERTVLAAGLTAELESCVSRLMSVDPGLWMVPSWRVRNDREIGNARNAFGVDAVLTAFLQPGETAAATVQLQDAVTRKPLRSFQVPAISSGAWGSDLLAQVAQVLEIDVGELPHGAGGRTADPEALAAVVRGLGYLGIEDKTRLEAAVSAFDAALACDSTLVTAHVGRASAWYARRTDPACSNWAEEALASCERALQLDDTYGDAYTTRGRIHVALGEQETALEDFTNALSRNARDPDAGRLLAKTYADLGRYDRAEAAYRAGIRASPDYWGGHEDLGYLYYVQGRLDSAIVQFQTVIALAPEYASAYNYLGALFYAQDRWDEAIPMFEKSFDLERTRSACSNLGTLYYMKERFEDAARMYEWAREYDKSSYLAIGNLATAYLWMDGKEREASQLFEEAIQLAEVSRQQKTDDPALIGYLAGYYSIDHPKKAVEMAEQALRVAPDNAEVLYRCALVYERLGKRPRALVLLGHAIKHGYSVQVISHERELKELRSDPRYELLVTDGSQGLP